MLEAMRTPVTLFTGYLGSGKTTLISHLIDELQAAGCKTVYLKNEIGSEDIDGQLMRGKQIETRQLLNGCICCTLVGPFLSAINEVLDTYHPDRLIIEASGAADPSAIALMISSHPRLTRDGVIGVIDVVNFTGYTDLSETARHQAEFVDLLVFNKVELADLEQKRRVVGYVRELNTHSPIVEALSGKVATELVCGLDGRALDALLNAHKESDHDHLSHEGLESVTLTSVEPKTAAAWQTWLETLPPQVFRVKGFGVTPNGVVVLNKVGKRASVETLEKQNEKSISHISENKVVCIGFGVTTAKLDIESNS
jgi:G3E family GTPase